MQYLPALQYHVSCYRTSATSPPGSSMDGVVRSCDPLLSQLKHLNPTTPTVSVLWCNTYIGITLLVTSHHTGAFRTIRHCSGAGIGPFTYNYVPDFLFKLTDYQRFRVNFTNTSSFIFWHKEKTRKVSQPRPRFVSQCTIRIIVFAERRQICCFRIKCLDCEKCIV